MATANAYFHLLKKEPEPMLIPWLDAKLGDPLLVRTVDLEPSHWIVPVVRRGKVLGRISVNKEGRVMGHAYFHQSSEDLSMCPSFVTRLSSEEAFHQAKQILDSYVGAEFSEPVFVLNGFRNQLAWMIKVLIGGELISRVFVTPSYVYERTVGQKPPPPGWRGRATVG